MKKGFCFGASLALLISLAAFPVLAQAQSYPGQPIQMVIPMAPGDTVDLTGRAIATEMAKILNTPVVPVNKAGGGGAIGADSVAKAKERRLHDPLCQFQHLLRPRDEPGERPLQPAHGS